MGTISRMLRTARTSHRVTRARLPMSPMTVPSTLTLLFAATAIGTLNLVSVGFGVLFVGIAVDFGLQFSVRLREARHDVGDGAAALRWTADPTTRCRQSLTRFLPLELDRLRTALGAVPADIHSAPSNVARDWLPPDGQARVEVLPVATAHNSQGLHKLVAEVSAVAPDAGGTAVTVIATSDTIISAFRSAAIAAVLAIAVLLLVALRRLRYAALVLAPLLLSAALTMLVMVLLRFPLNYANIIPLPLLLGVGVSFNIYFVMNWRAGGERCWPRPRRVRSHFLP